MNGKIEFYQQTEYDVTNVEVSLEGLDQNSGYHVHIVSTRINMHNNIISNSRLILDTC